MVSIEPRRSPLVWLLMAVSVLAIDIVLGIALVRVGDMRLLGMAIFLWVATLPVVVLALVRARQLRRGSGEA